MTKTCGMCKLEKEIEEHFHKRGKKYQSDCKSCKSIRFKAWREVNLERELKNHYERKKKAVDESKAHIREYLKTHHCVKCGESDPIVLEFDHRDPNEKEFDISQGLHKKWLQIAEEIKKCDVMCCNCHRRKTAHQFGWTK